MKNLNGYLKKILLTFGSTLLLFIPIQNSYAQENFNVKTEIYHDITEDVIASTIYYTITTTDNPRVITYYTTTIPQSNIKPDIYLINKNKKLEPTYHNRSGVTDIVVDLENAVVSQDKPITLKMTYYSSYDSSNISVLSKITDTQTNKLTVTYPQSMGETNWTSTPISKINTKGNKYEIVIDNPQLSNTTLTIGQNIYYEFTISKNLLNSTNEMYISELIIPPNNNRQKILLNTYEPQPNNSYMDSNGNYILQYELAPQSNLPINIHGYILMEHTLPKITDAPEIEKKEYWNISDSKEISNFNKYLIDHSLIQDDQFSNISELADSSSKELFYKLAYDYIINKLEPNNLTLGSLTGGIRLGATRTLQSDSSTTAEDYSDTLIGIFREYGVPARMVIGYVTDVSDSNPDGMYHNWLEYYDDIKKDWVPLDPFLEDYSKVSLWHRDLLDHITLIYRYDNPNTPKLPYYTENDLKISRYKPEKDLDFVYNIQPSLILQPYKITDTHLKGGIYIKNIGNTIIDNFEITKSSPDINKYLDNVENNAKRILLPEQETELLFNIPIEDIKEVIFTMIKGISGNTETNEGYLETNIELAEKDTNLKIFSKLLSILIYLIIALGVYLLSKKLEKKYG